MLHSVNEPKCSANTFLSSLCFSQHKHTQRKLAASESRSADVGGKKKITAMIDSSHFYTDTSLDLGLQGLHFMHVYATALISQHPQIIRVVEVCVCVCV